MGPPYMVVGYVGSPASATVKRHPLGGGNPTLSTEQNMGILNEDVVVIKKAGDNTLITVNCPGKTCLGCDLC
ncbi:hypothetical protein HanIR_Chr11g0545211 [Helianthus annuus]|nr:hypothetical protein HanIR_Chr11g0545211 [Helianthus annuus]